MPDVGVLTNSGAETMVPASTFQAFQAGVRGAIVRPADVHYDAAARPGLRGTLAARGSRKPRWLWW
jgi:hypothetical protein